MEFSDNSPKVPELFSEDQIVQIFDACHDLPRHRSDWGIWERYRDRTIIAVMYHCALRPNECLSLKFSDFDHKMQIRIRPETNKERSGRIIPLSEKAMPFLKEYLQFPRERFWQGSAYLFPSFENKLTHIKSATWKARFRTILKRAGLWLPPQNSTIPPFRSYTLRISKATHMLEKTHDVQAIRLILGHKKLESTTRYLKLTSNYQNWLRQVMS